MKPTDTETQLKILAHISRGDSYEEIAKEFNIAVSTVSAIKKRNESTLAIIKERMIDHQISKSKQILDKGHRLIEQRLDKALSADSELEKLNERLERKEINLDEFLALRGSLYQPTLTELNAIAKEAFNQSQIEQGKPTAVASTPQGAVQQLNDLVNALNKGDEVQLFKMVLNPSDKQEILEGETV